MLNALSTKNIEFRKSKDSLASFTSTLIGEIKMYAKNDGNREVTDDDVIRVMKKFKNSLTETISLYQQSGRDTAQLENEIGFLVSFLPEEISEEVVRQTISEMIGDQEKSMKLMGLLMGQLKGKFGEALDGKMASKVAKEMLS